MKEEQELETLIRDTWVEYMKKDDFESEEFVLFYSGFKAAIVKLIELDRLK